MKPIIRRILYITLSVFLIGILFKIQSWPFATELLLLAYGSFFLVSVGYFLSDPEKDIADYTTLTMAVCFSVGGILSILHLPYKEYIYLLFWIAFLLWLILKGITFLKKPNKKLTTLNIVKYFMFGFSIILIIVGSVFKIQSWPYASELLTIGLLTAAVAFIINALFKSNEPSSLEEEDDISKHLLD